MEKIKSVFDIIPYLPYNITPKTKRVVAGDLGSRGVGNVLFNVFYTYVPVSSSVIEHYISEKVH